MKSLEARPFIGCPNDFITSYFYMMFWLVTNSNATITLPISSLLSAVLLWLLTAACIKTGRVQIARRAIEVAETRLLKDSWPEYYDGKLGRYIGKQARKFQTWSIAGYLVAKMMLEDPSNLGMVSLEEDKAMKPVLKRSASFWFWCEAPPDRKVVRILIPLFEPFPSQIGKVCLV